MEPENNINPETNTELDSEMVNGVTLDLGLHSSLQSSFMSLPSDINNRLTPGQLASVFVNPSAWQQMIANVLSELAVTTTPAETLSHVTTTTIDGSANEVS